MKILGILLLITSVNSFTLAMFYCGIVDGHCVQSKTDDVYPGSTFVILAFVNVSANGSASVTPAHFPDITPWTTTGKKVLISVGGEYGNWDYVFQSPEHSQLFVTSLTDIVQNYSLDGVDLDI